MIGMYYNSIDPMMGLTPGIKAFVAAVLGGIGSIPGAAIGGIVIGFLETMFQSIGLSAYKDAAVYAVLIIICWFCRQGCSARERSRKCR